MLFDLFDSPELLDIQRIGFYRFLKQGIPQLLAKEFPIKVKNGNCSIELLLNEQDIKLITPEDDPRDCILKMKSYSCKLYARLKIVCKNSRSKIIYQGLPEWVFLGQLPMMTKRGHFIINGSPRVVVHQVVRAPGIYFQKLSKKDDKDRARFYGDIIPLKGVWVRLQITKKGRIEAKFKKGKKVEAEFLQRCLQVVEDQSLSSLNTENSCFGRFDPFHNSLPSTFLRKTFVLGDRERVANMSCNPLQISFNRSANTEKTKMFEQDTSRDERYTDSAFCRARSGKCVRACTPKQDQSRARRDVFLYDDFSKFLEKRKPRLESRAEHDAFVHTYDKLYRTTQDKELEEWQKKKKNSSFLCKSKIGSKSPHKRSTRSKSKDLERDNRSCLTRDRNFDSRSFSCSRPPYSRPCVRACPYVCTEGRATRPLPFTCSALQRAGGSATKINSHNEQITARAKTSLSLPCSLCFREPLLNGPFRGNCAARTGMQSNSRARHGLQSKGTAQYDKTRYSSLGGRATGPAFALQSRASEGQENDFKRKKCSENLFSTFKIRSKYDLGVLGREKINNKFGFLSYKASTLVTKSVPCVRACLPQLSGLYGGSATKSVAQANNSRALVGKSKFCSAKSLCPSSPLFAPLGHGTSLKARICVARTRIAKWERRAVQAEIFFSSQNRKGLCFLKTSKKESRSLLANQCNHQLTSLDLCSASLWLYKLRKGEENSDDIDHSQNRRVRSSGELLQTQFENGVYRLRNLVSTKLQENRGGVQVNSQSLPFNCSAKQIKCWAGGSATKPEGAGGSATKSLSNLFETSLGRKGCARTLPLLRHNHTILPSALLNQNLCGYAQLKRSALSTPLFSTLNSIGSKKQNMSSVRCSFSLFCSAKSRKALCGLGAVAPAPNLGVTLQSKVTPSVRPGGRAPKGLCGGGWLYHQDLQRECPDKESKRDHYKLSIKELFSTKPITGALREFFGSNPLSQYMDQTNPLAEITHKRRISSLGVGGVSRESAGMAIRGIHPTHYGRICPIETPEGKNAGLVNSLAFYTKVDKNGFLKTPYYRVFKGQIQSSLGFSFCSAREESRASLEIAPSDLQKSQNNVLRTNLSRPHSVPVRVADNLLDVFKKENPYKIELMAISPIQMISVATSLIPFLEHNDANRALMGSNMQRQAVPLMISERPIVGTGLEANVIVESGHITESQLSGFASHIAANRIVVDRLEENDQHKTLCHVRRTAWRRGRSLTLGGRATGPSLALPPRKQASLHVKMSQNKLFCLPGKESSLDRLKKKQNRTDRKKKVLSKFCFAKQPFLRSTESQLTTFFRSNQNTSIAEKPLIKEFDWVQKGDVLSDCSASNNGELAVGKNVLVAYIPWEGYNFEDAIVISERLVREHVYTSLHIERYVFQAQDLKDGTEWFTKHLPGVEPKFVEHLEQSGLPKIGSFLKEGDILVGKTRYLNKKPSSPYERLLCDILGEKNFSARNKSLYVPKGVEARVVYHKVINRFDNERASQIRPLDPTPLLSSMPLLGGQKRGEQSNSICFALPCLTPKSNPWQQSHSPHTNLGVTSRSKVTPSVCGAFGVRRDRWLCNQGFTVPVRAPVTPSGAQQLQGTDKQGEKRGESKGNPKAISVSLYNQRVSKENRERAVAVSSPFTCSALQSKCWAGGSATKKQTLPCARTSSGLAQRVAMRVRATRSKSSISACHLYTRFRHSILKYEKPRTCLYLAHPYSLSNPLQDTDTERKAIALRALPPAGLGQAKARPLLALPNSQCESGSQSKGKAKKKVKLSSLASIGMRARVHKEVQKGGSRATSRFLSCKNRCRAQQKKETLFCSRNPVAPWRGEAMQGGASQHCATVSKSKMSTVAGQNADKICTRRGREHDMATMGGHQSAKTVHLFLGERRVIQVGDKISGRHGNKGVISTILPRQDMPYLPDGTPIDIILNPLGVPSRMNVGQVLESLLGLAALYLNQHFKIAAFDERYGVEASKSVVFLKLYQARLQSGQNWLFQASFPGKTRLIDGRSGECFDQWITVGKAYILKLIHMVTEKIHARSTGPYALITQQPLRGRSNKGGQRLGEMEVWALEGFGAAYTLQELLTKKSDDFFGRKQIVDSILPNPSRVVDVLKPDYRIDQSRPVLGHPEIFKVLLCELQALCLDLGVYILTPESFQRSFLGVVH